MTDERPVVEQSEMLEMLAKAEREDWQHPMWGWLRALLAERDALQAELADTRKLLDPAVVAAAKSLERNADTHPDGCCSVCTEGLAERDALRQRVTELEARVEYWKGPHDQMIRDATVELRQRVTELEETANRLAALHALELRALMEKYNA